MEGLFINICTEKLIQKLISIGYTSVKQDIYFGGTMVTSDGKIRYPSQPFKPWNPDGKGWQECKIFYDENKFLELADKMLNNTIYDTEKTKNDC